MQIKKILLITIFLLFLAGVFAVSESGIVPKERFQHVQEILNSGKEIPSGYTMEGSQIYYKGDLLGNIHLPYRFDESKYIVDLKDSVLVGDDGTFNQWQFGKIIKRIYLNESTFSIEYGRVKNIYPIAIVENKLLFYNNNKLIKLDIDESKEEILSEYVFDYRMEGKEKVRFINYITHQEILIDWTKKSPEKEIINEKVYMYFDTFENVGNDVETPYPGIWLKIHNIYGEEEHSVLAYETVEKKLYILSDTFSKKLAEGVESFYSSYAEETVAWIDSSGNYYENIYSSANSYNREVTSGVMALGQWYTLYTKSGIIDRSEGVHYRTY